MSSNKDTTVAEKQDDEVVQTSIRIPVELYKAVAHEVAEKGPGFTVQQLWIDAMRAYLDRRAA